VCPIEICVVLVSDNSSVASEKTVVDDVSSSTSGDVTPCSDVTDTDDTPVLLNSQLKPIP